MKKKPQPKTLVVTDTETITPNMQRITLQGEALSHFPRDCEGSYIKLLFNDMGGADLSILSEDDRPIMRTYTIRRFHPETSTIEVDFVRHVTQDLQGGFAARWAMAAQKGDTINIVGPGSISNLNTEADWFFMAADMTALPALSAKIRTLPEEAKGHAVISVMSPADIQPLHAPAGMELIWLTEGQALADSVRELEWLDGNASIWCACEFDSMRALRQYFRNEKEVDRECSAPPKMNTLA
ncbi:siderophore-interacting protein [Vibrio parahaemolyticus]|uniref:siderophore-interacting protein n=2 Tax=Vibrio parahaemolyticus TaxID=670 RepID=UPI000C86E160|nr:siderophore-interacting protein [Vibrio parahaemolyticus]PMS43599.1 NADPH-dependent ferric siderophore reductase [Vibrio parahaemolyticus]PMS44714.1 NADPH-dependent ferric siderophore reductase [Vibrio parahaemolyticus]PMS60297.1 NADPH-dependent ferric siderophore reductase [Vibrio parahaemolyticus]PMS90385.1 NADPH-dependent ferric siderophore reductase [Vibrio parahaemolyticus]PMS91167.1 NADPH-dependent ferric siderophore reductase [Vibrio parahaemolyticus]